MKNKEGRHLEVKEKYVAYDMNRVMGNEKYLALEKIQFDGFIQNNFKTEKEAIQALINDDKIGNWYVILKEIYISEY